MRESIDLYDYIMKKHREFPGIAPLDLLFYAIKGFGLSFSNNYRGRPKFHIADATNLFSIVPLMSNPKAPLSADDHEQLRGLAMSLGVRVRLYPRVSGKLSYYYLRSNEKDIQTLGSETILNTNFNPTCYGCYFCSRGYDGYASIDLQPVCPEEGFKMLDDAGIFFPSLSEIAVVTGMFPSESYLLKHLIDVHRLAVSRGFSGRFFYLGCQLLTSDNVSTILDSIQSSRCSFRYAFTVESFSRTDIMHHQKRASITSILCNLSLLRKAGVSDLQFTYMPGIDPIDEFLALAPSFADLATPHISIFRPATTAHETLRASGFIEDPVAYLCNIRCCAEKYWGGPVYGNNLGNLWPFPLRQINGDFSIFN